MNTTTKVFAAAVSVGVFHYGVTGAESALASGWPAVAGGGGALAKDIFDYYFPSKKAEKPSVPKPPAQG